MALLNFKQGLRMLLFVLLIVPALIVSAEINPTLGFMRMGQNWENITLLGLRGVTSAKGDDLFLDCEAPYPIRWNITGQIVPPEIVKIQLPKGGVLQNMFHLRVIIFFGEAATFPGLLSSVKIACESVMNNQLVDEIFVFVRGNKPLVEATPKVVTNSKLIPCPTTDPSTQTLLYLKGRGSGRSETLVSNVKYSPTEGFISEVVFNGNYICRQESFTNEISATITQREQFSNHHFSPAAEYIKVFTEDTISVTCNSTNRSPITLTFQGNTPINLTYKINEEYSKRVELSVIPDTFNESFTGSVSCMSSLANGNQILIKDWTYEFVETPEVYFDNFEGEIYCLSPLQNKVIQTVRCKNDMDCDFMSHCLQNVSWCNYKKQKQFFTTTDTFCWLEALQIGKACASVPYSHLNDSNWQNAPENELLRMDEVNSVLYTNSSTTFFCSATAYLFTDDLGFQIEYQNGTKTFLKENDLEELNFTIEHPLGENLRRVDEFNVIGVLEITLPLEAVAIHCVAFWWNSTNVMVASRTFQTKHLLPPIIDSQDETRQENFYLDQSNQRLTCKTIQGEPPPQFEWYFVKDGTLNNVSTEFPELKTSIGSDGESYLEFPSVKYDYGGEWICVAINNVDKSQRKYSVTISDEPISRKNIVYISIIIPILIILAFVMVALVIFMRRYREAKELVRSLTDSEIDEFFQGKPELLQAGHGNSVDTIEFLPYKTEFEISLDDIEFDSSEKNLLGSGEFSYVVRGKIISKSKPVAVKISKPTADVTLFKSLLSEVKIMIYIGEHAHVVKLIGVCTQGIRNRSIHIATEICDLGGLDGILRKARPKFTNLINENQEIDLNLLPQGNVEVSTLDLISFSEQIAAGMEYLSFKSVVHADLAARNVLVTSDKIAKVSDFGLSRKLYECNNYVKKSKSPLPWRWMPIESLTTLTFSTKSDVWSYGATLFEIFTLGDIPFPNEEWNKEFLTRLSTGMRMGRPKYSTQEIYSKIVACWESEPEMRPTFAALRIQFANLLRKYRGESPAQAGQQVKEEEPVTKYIPVPRTGTHEAEISQPLYANSDAAISPSPNYVNSP